MRSFLFMGSWVSFPFCRIKMMSSKDVIDDSVAWLCLMVAVLYATVILRRPEHVPRSSSQQREARNTYNNTSSIRTLRHSRLVLCRSCSCRFTATKSEGCLSSLVVPCYGRRRTENVTLVYSPHHRRKNNKYGTITVENHSHSVHHEKNEKGYHSHHTNFALFAEKIKSNSPKLKPVGGHSSPP